MFLKIHTASKLSFCFKTSSARKRSPFQCGLVFLWLSNKLTACHRNRIGLWPLTKTFNNCVIFCIFCSFCWYKWTLISAFQLSIVSNYKLHMSEKTTTNLLSFLLYVKQHHHFSVFSTSLFYLILTFSMTPWRQPSVGVSAWERTKTLFRSNSCI